MERHSLGLEVSISHKKLNEEKSEFEVEMRRRLYENICI